MKQLDFVYLLNSSLKKINIIDYYISVIWVRRYCDVGEFELYLPAKESTLEAIQSAKFVMRPDDDMIGMIQKIELKTSVENGDFITVSGKSLEFILSQRIIWNTINYDGLLENLIHRIVTDSFNVQTLDLSLLGRDWINPESPTESVIDVKSNGLQDSIIRQISYKNALETIKDLCSERGWGFMFTYPDFTEMKVLFEVYKADDLSNKIRFSEALQNLDESTYTFDNSNVANTVLIGGAGEGVYRGMAKLISNETGINRIELFCDAKDISNKFTLAQLKEMYPEPNGYVAITTIGGEHYTYNVATLDVPILSSEHEEQLRAILFGQKITINGIDYWRLSNQTIAHFAFYEPGYSLQDSDEATLDGYFYPVFLWPEGNQALSDKKINTTFEAKINPYGVFKYKKDWNLGNIVNIRNKYGISSNARIVEVLESFDENGYKIEPKLEYLTEG